MPSPVTLDQALSTVLQLPVQQQDILLEIVRHRINEARRREIAEFAEQARKDFQEGRLTVCSADNVIQTLHQSLLEEDA